MMGMSREEVLAFNAGIVEEFRANDGTCGGMFEGNPMLLVTMTGAKSGKERIVPLTYHGYEDDFVIMASGGGSPTHPAWYHNLVANPQVTLEVGTEQFTATAHETSGDERTALFSSMVTAMPRFGDYQAGVEREIPVFRLARN